MSNSDRRKKLEGLLKLDPIDDESALATLGQAIDLVGDLQEHDALERVFERVVDIGARKLSPGQRTLLHYFEGNAWSLKTQFRSISDQKTQWSWEAEDLAGQILAFRRAAISSGFRSLSKQQMCQILTNLGNTMNRVGRFIEAINYWDRALEIDPKFGMAIGNKGVAIVSYMLALHDDNDKPAFAHVAHRLLSEALEQHLEGDAALELQAKREYLRRGAPDDFFAKPFDLGASDFGTSKYEQRYRAWCLQRRLFVNPLNDVLSAPGAAADVLILPTVSGPLNELGSARSWLGLFNVLKQELVAARTLLWEGFSANEMHFADRNLHLMDTLDGSRFGYAREKVKYALRSAYSILDRIGFLLNSYFRLEIPHHQVQFRTLWYDKQKKAKGLRAEFANRENWPLCGLFWLSKDLDGKDEGLQDCLEPDAQAIQNLRNHLEHKYLKVEGEEAFDDLDFAPDSLCLRVTSDDLNAKALHTVRLARASLVYLSLAIHAEERRRHGGSGDSDDSGKRKFVIDTSRILDAL